MTDDKLRQKCWDLQREVDRLTGANQALQDVNGRLQVERALSETRQAVDELALLRRRVGQMETEHAKQIQALETRIQRLDGRVNEAARFVKEHVSTNGATE